MATANIIEEFITAVELNHQTSYGHVAAITVYAYDILLSSGEEVVTPLIPEFRQWFWRGPNTPQIKYIWTSNWSIVKALYFFIRYYGIVLLIAIIASSTSVNTNIKVYVCTTLQNPKR